MGGCKCVCNPSCHPYRQKLQIAHRENFGTKIEECIFYKYLIVHYSSNKEEE